MFLGARVRAIIVFCTFLAGYACSKVVLDGKEMDTWIQEKDVPSKTDVVKESDPRNLSPAEINFVNMEDAIDPRFQIKDYNSPPAFEGMPVQNYSKLNPRPNLSQQLPASQTSNRDLMNQSKTVQKNDKMLPGNFPNTINRETKISPLNSQTNRSQMNPSQTTEALQQKKPSGAAPSPQLLPNNTQATSQSKSNNAISQSQSQLPGSQTPNKDLANQSKMVHPTDKNLKEQHGHTQNALNSQTNTTQTSDQKIKSDASTQATSQSKSNNAISHSQPQSQSQLPGSQTPNKDLANQSKMVHPTDKNLKEQHGHSSQNTSNSQATSQSQSNNAISNSQSPVDGNSRGLASEGAAEKNESGPGPQGQPTSPSGSRESVASINESNLTDVFTHPAFLRLISGLLIYLAIATTYRIKRDRELAELMRRYSNRKYQ